MKLFSKGRQLQLNYLAKVMDKLRVISQAGLEQKRVNLRLVLRVRFRVGAAHLWGTSVRWAFWRRDGGNGKAGGGAGTRSSLPTFLPTRHSSAPGASHEAVIFHLSRSGYAQTPCFSADRNQRCRFQKKFGYHSRLIHKVLSTLKLPLYFSK